MHRPCRHHGVTQNGLCICKLSDFTANLAVYPMSMVAVTVSEKLHEGHNEDNRETRQIVSYWLALLESKPCLARAICNLST